MLILMLEIILFIISILIFPISIIVLFYPNKYYSLPIFVLSCIFWLVGMFVYFAHAKKQLKKHKEILLLLDINKAKEKIGEKTSIIEFEKNGDTWTCKKDDKLQLNLRGYAFQKSFILAWIIRNIRYKTISGKGKLEKLFSGKLEIKNLGNLIVRFRYDNKIKEYFVVKNYISKCGTLPGLIILSMYKDYLLLGHNGYISGDPFKQVRLINERLYLTGRYNECDDSNQQ